MGPDSALSPNCSRLLWGGGEGSKTARVRSQTLDMSDRPPSFGGIKKEIKMLQVMNRNAPEARTNSS